MQIEGQTLSLHKANDNAAHFAVTLRESEYWYVYQQSCPN
jgi:hypothetical protein